MYSRSVVGNSHAPETDAPDYGTSSSLTGGVHSLLESAEGALCLGLSSELKVLKEKKREKNQKRCAAACAVSHTHSLYALEATKE